MPTTSTTIVSLAKSEKVRVYHDEDTTSVVLQSIGLTLILTDLVWEGIIHAITTAQKKRQLEPAA
jgi:hypothetical protein